MLNKTYQSSIINIDSNDRNIIPKHIYESYTNYLEEDPLEFTKDSSIIKIKFNKHNLQINDIIIIQNVQGLTKILNNSIYLIDNFNYAIVDMYDNNISKDYIKYNQTLYAYLELYTKYDSTYINNIPINNILGIKQIFIGVDLFTYNINSNNIIFENIPDNLVYLVNTIYPNNNINEVLISKFIFIKLYKSYNNHNEKFYNSILSCKITYLHINGIDLGYINANYPINNYNYQASHTVINVIDNETFEIDISKVSYLTNKAGGKNIYIYKIINSLTGYPESNDYTINLKKTFNNVVSINLLSTELPYIDILIKKNVNDKLYWKHIDDGDHVYILQIKEGFYTITKLLSEIKENINNTKRITYSNINILYNHFDIELNTSTHQIFFKSFVYTKLPNSLSVRKATLEGIEYFILSVTHINNIVDVNDIITISNSIYVTIQENSENAKLYAIDNVYINKEHTVYSVNQINESYEIILGKVIEITPTLLTYITSGGENIIIKSKTRVSFLFNKKDTMGELLGFLNTGTIYAITDYKSIHSNQDFYPNSVALNATGNSLSYLNGFINASGKYNYILMYLNDIEYVYNNNLQPAFAKILLSGNPGDILFNTFVANPPNVYSKTFPIPTLSDIKILFLYPDGTPVNFRNMNYSFTLQIIEEKII